ncbi:MFS transporter [Amycolatopsis cihanbeyliensis]|uniref:MFS transporter n=1 Tax=Amycolatopsis cihanbeyliensis TaxID=1128664 RepID=UPI001FE6F646|nr:MFS transporter [Amycolatopsis cihanbeyliensis]
MRTGIYVVVVLTAGAYLPSPLYPGYQGAIGFSDLTMTVIYATFALVSAPALLLCGSASDALGPRTVLRAAVVAAAVGTACFAVASGTMWLVVGRAAQGIALGAATGAASALIGQHAGGSKGGGGTVPASTAFVAGTAIGPIAGGLLAQYAPAPLVLPFVLHLVLLWFGWRAVSALPAPSAPRARRWIPTRPRVPAGARPLFATAALTGFLAWAVAGLFLSVIPALLDRAAHTNLAVTGGVLGAVLVCSVLAQPVVPRVGPRYAQLAGLAALSGSVVVLALSLGGRPSLTLLAAVIAGAGHGLAYGGAVAAMERGTPPDRRGAVTGALYLAFYLGAGCPAIAIGLITLGHSLMTATLCVTAAVAVLVPLNAAAVVSVRPAERPCPRRSG